MAIDERQRHVLHEKLDHVLGPDEAATPMAHLPPVGWADVARRSDLDHLGAVLRSEFRSGFDGLRAEMHREFAEVRKELGAEIGGLRREIGAVRGELGAEIGAVRGELGAEIGAVRGELGAEIGAVRTQLGAEIGGVRAEVGQLRDQIASGNRQLVLAIIASQFTAVSLAFAAMSLAG